MVQFLFVIEAAVLVAPTDGSSFLQSACRVGDVRVFCGHWCNTFSCLSEMLSDVFADLVVSAFALKHWTTFCNKETV